MLKRKKTKIVATLGPATNSKEVLKGMLDEGANVFRINFSHADYEDVKERVQMIRELNEEFGYNASILADLQGPKLRIGKVHDGVKLKKGSTLTFTSEKIIGDESNVYMSYKNFAKEVKIGENILIDDGKIVLKVIKSNLKNEVQAQVIQGGPLKSRKGVNLPNTAISIPALTKKDIKDALFILDYDVDWIALSFVRHANDIKDLKKLINDNSDYQIPIIAKIEKPEALANINEILKECDAIMVARGDLGIEIPIEEVPIAQKELVAKAKLAHKPVIIATQMLESMIDSITPTRAEVNDVANSVLDGADALMLSGETSVGEHPLEVIEKMTQIILKVENHPSVKVPSNKPVNVNRRFITDMLCFNASKMVKTANVKAIIGLTASGYTAFQISSNRPLTSILIFTSNKRLIPMLNLLWGVKAYYYKAESSTDDTISELNKLAIEKSIVKKDDYVINLNAMPVSENGITNTLRLSTV